MPTSQNRDMGHPAASGKLTIEFVRPTLRKNAKDGAPELLRLVRNPEVVDASGGGAS
jgi:hypothetical protein